VRVGRTTAALRSSALIALGAFVVHQLRYVGGGGGSAHGYLEALLPVLVVLAASAVVGTLAVARSSGRTTGGATPGWPSCSAALLVIFGVQETVEGMLSAGHPGGPADVLGHGGWVAVPLAIVIGRVVSLLLRGLGSVERRLAAARPAAARRAPGSLGRARAMQARAPTGEPLEFGLARRPPPQPSG
jgi:hypothetical protein